MCRDVDDPEYKPAPALLKDDIEVRSHDWLSEHAHVSIALPLMHIIIISSRTMPPLLEI